MFSNSKICNSFRYLAIALVAVISIFVVNPAIDGLALAADNYSASTDTYQETRNPNRVNTTMDELKNSNINKPTEEEGKSIYENLAEKVDKKRKASLKDLSEQDNR